MTTTKTLIAASAIALLSNGAAFAQEATSDAWMQTAQSTTTRADDGAITIVANDPECGGDPAFTEVSG